MNLTTTSSSWPYNGSSELKNFRNTSQTMYNHLTFLILIKMMLKMIFTSNINPNLKIGIAKTLKLLPGFSILQSNPSILSLPYLRLSRRFGIIWSSGIHLLMEPMSISWDLNFITFVSNWVRLTDFYIKMSNYGIT